MAALPPSPRSAGQMPPPQRLQPIQGPKRQPGTVHETSGGPGCRAPHERSALGRTSPTRGPVEARIRPRIERQAGPTPPAGCPSLRRTAHGPTRGRAEAWNRPRNQWRAKPEPPCTACRLRGVQGPPWSIFGHFLLIKKVATWASDVCLTISQTTALPMAQGKTSPDLRCDRSITRMKA